MRTTIVLCALTLILSAPFLVLGDTWSFSPELTVKTQQFGKTKIVLSIDAREDQGFPPHTLCVYHGDELLAKIPNVGFEKLYASKDNQTFVGLSNYGIPGTALIVFDAKGNLIREVKHRHMPYGIHTKHSITVIREWVDLEGAVKFDSNDRAIYVKGTTGQRYNLLAPDLDFDIVQRFTGDEPD